jgi:hypothetical protein
MVRLGGAVLTVTLALIALVLFVTQWRSVSNGPIIFGSAAFACGMVFVAVDRSFCNHKDTK